MEVYPPPPPQGLAEILPRVIRQSIIKYYRFIRDPMNEESTEKFQKHQAACKAAVAHLELLLKLSKTLEASESGGGGKEAAQLEKLLEKTAQDMARFSPLGEGGEEGGEERDEEGKP